MKVVLLYLHVTKSGYPEASPPEYYWPFSERFIQTYRKFKPGFGHDLRVVCCGQEADNEVLDLYGPDAAEYIVYRDGGSDIGACQHAMKSIDADLVVCMSTPVYFHRAGWLKRLVEAWEYFGDGLYGPFASYQISPHIRTSCWAVSPKTFNQYPDLIDTRGKCCAAECHRGQGMHQISDWYIDQGKPALMVTWSAVKAREEWRSVDNIFRRGNQSNCLVWDQHCDVYFAAHYHDRQLLERAADFYEDNGPLPANPEKV